MADEKKNSLFSGPIISSTEEFDSDYDLDSNGIILDPDQEIYDQLFDEEPVVDSTQPVTDIFNNEIKTKPLESPTSERTIPLGSVDSGDTVLFEESLDATEDPLDDSESFTESLFQSEPLDPRVAQQSKTPISNKKTINHQVSDFYTNPINQLNLSNAGTKTFSDEPKKSPRRGIILGLIAVIVVGCLIWFMSLIFSSSQTDEDALRQIENQTNTQTTTPTDRNQTHNHFEGDRFSEGSGITPTERPSNSQDNTNQDSYPSQDDSYDYDYTYPDYSDDYYEDPGYNDIPDYNEPGNAEEIVPDEGYYNENETFDVENYSEMTPYYSIDIPYDQDSVVD